MSRVLVVAPHPDDEVIGCGGSIAKHVAAGSEVTVVIVIDRERGTEDAELADDDFAAETQSACRTLGVKEHICMAEPSRDITVDRRLHLDLVQVMRRIRPTVVYLPHEADGDMEHRAVHQLTLEALWMAQSNFFEGAGKVAAPAPQLVLGYEVWATLSRVQYSEDIGPYIDQKVAAMRCYASQLRHASWDEAVRGLAAYRGVTAAGHGYHEAFEVIQLGSLQPHRSR